METETIQVYKSGDLLASLSPIIMYARNEAEYKAAIASAVGEWAFENNHDISALTWKDSLFGGF